MAFFKLKNATARYNGTAVLHGISLEINRGERVALVGPSGAGKSTLLSLLLKQRTHETSMVPQEGGLVKPLSVFHNVYIGRLNQHNAWYNILNLIYPLKSEVALMLPILEELGLDDKMFTPTGELSGGQQQRTAIARGLYHGGDALLGDEPVSAVDLHQARNILEAINTAYDTVVLAMHDVQLAIEFTDRLIGLRDGRIIFDKPSSEVNPKKLESFYTS